MLEQKQVLSALLHFARASVEYREISEGIVREKSQSSPGFPLSTGRHAPPTLAQCSSSLPPKVDTPAAYVWLPLVIGSDVGGATQINNSYPFGLF
jgi:hypothetical protein